MWCDIFEEVHVIHSAACDTLSEPTYISIIGTDELPYAEEKIPLQLVHAYIFFSENN